MKFRIGPGPWALPVLALLGGGTVQTAAATFCPVDVSDPAANLLAPVFSSDVEVPTGSTEIRADNAELVENGESVFTGNVEVVRDDAQLTTRRLRYNRNTEVVRFEDGGELFLPGLVWVGESGSVSLADDIVELNAGRYLTDEGGRGAAGRLRREQGPQRTLLEEVDFTTCTSDSPAWQISADEIDLDHPDDTGVARHAVVRAAGVPVFYSPYLSFPLSDARKSGFLVPTFRTSSEAGIDLHIPFYWNIAPNYDATLVARTITEHGGALGGEARYLRADQSGSGSFSFEFAPDDPTYDNKARGQVLLKLNQSFASQRGLLLVDYHQVSDDQYLEDFGTSLGVTSTRFLNRNVDLNYRANRWNGSVQLRNYQTIDNTLPPTAIPYRILPRVNLATRFGGNNQLSGTLVSQFSRFERDASVTGSRVLVEPRLFWPMRRAGFYATPSVELKAAGYWLDTLPDSGQEERPDRLLPVATFDTGLIAERRFEAFDERLLQTLEPRIFYLYTPYDNQDNIPVFDSGQFDFTFQNLFRDNRFSGGDRVGDANQVTLALTSRILNRQTGDERLRVSFGQVVYFENRKVTLTPGGTVYDNTFSETIGEVAAQLASGWQARTTVQWDAASRQTDKLVFALGYRPTDPDDAGKVVNLAYRQRRTVSDFIEQTDLSFQYPLTERWSTLGRWSYSLVDDRTTEVFGGVEYDHCCFGVRIGGRRFIYNTAGEFETGVFAQIHLKGLAGFGSANEAFVQGLIPGYRSPF